MRVRSVRPEENELLRGWWAHYNFPPPPSVMLPPTTGLVEGDDGTPIMASFLYFSDGGLVWMEWTVANPASTSEERQAGLELLVRHFRDLAKSVGMFAMFTNTPHVKFGERLEQAGFVKTEPGTNYTIFL